MISRWQFFFFPLHYTLLKLRTHKSTSEKNTKRAILVKRKVRITLIQEKEKQVKCFSDSWTRRMQALGHPNLVRQTVTYDTLC